MGGEKTTTKGETTVAATPEERELERMQLERQKANAPMQQQLDTNQYGLANLLLTGQNLPGNLTGAQGINEGQTQDMVNASLRDIYPQFQQAGIMDSGAAAQIASRTSADVRNQNAQFNVSAFQNLLNQALGGSSNLTGTNNQSNAILGSQLAGLRTTNTHNTTIGMNPFLKSFETSLGGGLGKAGSAGVSAGIGAMCWVAAEVFNGWSDIRTIQTRFYIMFYSPRWFRNMYIKFGKQIAEYISNKPILKNILRPLFELFSSKGKEKLNGRN